MSLINCSSQPPLISHGIGKDVESCHDMVRPQWAGSGLLLAAGGWVDRWRVSHRRGCLVDFIFWRLFLVYWIDSSLYLSELIGFSQAFLPLPTLTGVVGLGPWILDAFKCQSFSSSLTRRRDCRPSSGSFRKPLIVTFCSDEIIVVRNTETEKNWLIYINCSIFTWWNRMHPSKKCPEQGKS